MSIRPIFYVAIPVAAIVSASVWGGLLLGGIALRSSPGFLELENIDSPPSAATPVDTPVVQAVPVAAPRILTLEVHHQSLSSCMYYSSFDTSPVQVSADDQRLSLQRDFDFMDGCHWRAYETLTRAAGSNDFSYSYREEPTSCAEGSTPAIPCTREGIAR